MGIKLQLEREEILYQKLQNLKIREREVEGWLEEAQAEVDGYNHDLEEIRNEIRKIEEVELYEM